MKLHFVILLLFFGFQLNAQSICNPIGNLAVFSSYDGGILTINVDQNIPNLKIGICTYEPIQVSFTGAFVGNITQVIYAGMNSNQNNDNCGLGNFPTSITGVPLGIVTINPPMSPPPVGYTPAHGNGAGTWGSTMIGAAGLCDTTTNSGGGNTPDEIVYYFLQQTGGTLIFHKTQYNCWINETLDISAGGNCCILPPTSNPGCSLAGSVSVVPNSVCEPCFYSGPPILINELMISPTVNDGSISGPGPNGGRGEWIELYNPDLCDSVDISCYYLGNYTAEGTGGFRLPTGTIIPPNGFCMVRGFNAAPVPSNLLLQNGGNVMEVIVPSEINLAGICCSGTRVWFPNAGGWFAFYDATGNPVDAVRWGPGNTASLNGQPCVSSIGGCSNTSSLLSYNSIPNDLKFYASPADGGTHFGQTIRRFPDGGAWSGVGPPTYAICNDPLNCLTGSLIGYCNGQGTADVTGGTAPFNFQWDDDLNQTTQTATNLCEGTYHVTVTDANNCQETYTVNVVTNPFDLSANIVQPGCLLSNGSISIDPFDASYTYTWSPNVSTTNSASNLAQGSYQITITQLNCTYDTTIVLQNPVPFETIFQLTQTTCGENNGSILVDNTPNSAIYSYTWTPAISITNSATNLAPGDYQVSISDNTCAFDTVLTILPSIGLSSTSTIYGSTCGYSNGAIANFISPPSTYTFNWVPNVGNTDSISNLAPGSYTISFTDGTCSGDTVLLLPTTEGPNDLTSLITATQCASETGEILINNVVGGAAPYLFAIDNSSGSVNPVFENLGEGVYTITVIDSNNCFYTENVSVPVVGGPSFIQTELINPYCGLSNGSLIINGAVSGAPPYLFDVIGMSIAENNLLVNSVIDNLGEGAYQITVTDDNGCTLTQTAELLMEAGSPEIFIPNVLTGNDDVTNDIWKIIASCVENVNCEIFNRWGNKIYEFDQLTEGWDGTTMDGSKANDGVYFYKVTFDYYGDELENGVYQGHITLIR